MSESMQTPEIASRESGIVRNGEDERQRRAAALRSLAGGDRQLETGPKHGESPQRHRPRKQPSAPLVVIVSAVTLVVVIGASVAYGLWHGAHGAHRSTVISRVFADSAANGLDCPHDVGWAPGGSRIAVVGYTSDCPYVAGPYIATSADNLGGPGISRVGGLVNIYDANTGDVVTHLSPDEPIIKAIVVPKTVVAYEESQEKALGVKIVYYNINYTHVLWSPDGARIALTFTAFVPTGLPAPDANGEPTFPGRLAEGVEVMTIATGASNVYIHMLSGSAQTFLEWDLQSGALITPSSTLATSGSQYTVTPAQGYQWGAEGALTPVGSLTSSSASSTPGPIGDPDGRASFSLWQPGIASTQITGGQDSVSGAFNWTTDIAAWSPDGRYLAEGIAISGVVTSPQIIAPDSDALASAGWSTAPRIPARDAALGEVAKIAQKQAFPAIVTLRGTRAEAPTGVLLAWRPNGELLAVDTAASDANVTLLDTKNGKSVLTLQPLANPHFAHGPAEQNEANILRWSPDGSRLLLLDPSLETMTIWNLAGVAD